MLVTARHLLRSLASALSGSTPPPPTQGHDGRPLGRAGERQAARFLKRSGYRILGRNVRTRVGEADLVCEAPDGSTIVIVEVKTRARAEGQPHASAAIDPEASVTAHKRRNLRAIAHTLRRANKWSDRPCRIDVIAVEWTSHDRRPRIRHLVDAVGRE
jgi:putative endonuclease